MLTKGRTMQELLSAIFNFSNYFISKQKIILFWIVMPLFFGWYHLKKFPYLVPIMCSAPIHFSKQAKTFSQFFYFFKLFISWQKIFFSGLSCCFTLVDSIWRSSHIWSPSCVLLIHIPISKQKLFPQFFNFSNYLFPVKKIPFWGSQCLLTLADVTLRSSCNLSPP